MTGSPAPRRSLYYGWIVVGVTVPVLMLSAGMRSAPGAWLLPMQGDLGWSTATLSLAAAIGLLVYGFSGPVAGALIASSNRTAVPGASAGGTVQLPAVSHAPDEGSVQIETPDA